MFYHQASNQYIPEGEPFTIDGSQYPANWLNLSTPEDKAALGLVEVVTVGTREDDKYFYVSETLEGSVRTIVNTPKSAEQIAQINDTAAYAAAYQQLLDTDYLFAVDRHVILLAEEPEREALLRTSRELSREVIRAYKAKYPAV